MAKKTQYTVSIIIPVHNGGDKFKMCIESVGLCSPPPLEIIVVADGESDGSWRLAQEKGYKTLVLETTGGPAQARNLGATAANGEILLFVDADVTVSKDIIGRIDMLFARDKNLSAVIGSYDDNPFEKSLISQYRNLLHHFTHQLSEENGSTFWGACGAIKKSVFHSLGGFNRKYKSPSIEDIEFGYRLKGEDYQIRLQKDLLVTHLKKWSLISMLRTDIMNRAIPWSELVLERRSIINDLNLSHKNRFSIILAFLLMLSPLMWLSSIRYFLLTIVFFGLLLAVNKKFYAFLLQKRGLAFLLKSLPLHWLYFIYSGTSFIYVLLRKAIIRRSVKKRQSHLHISS